MEILGFNFDYEEQKLILETLLKHIESITINDAIVEKVIEIRKLRKIKLPDAIIYATAAVAGVDLITRNTDDFKGLGTSVNVIDPFDF
jgi:predicted nucleic acid-binding protein